MEPSLQEHHPRTDPRRKLVSGKIGQKVFVGHSSEKAREGGVSGEETILGGFSGVEDSWEEGPESFLKND